MTLLIIVAVVAIIIISSSIAVVKQSDVYITEFLGKYNRTLGPGLHFLTPFVERVAYKQDLRTIVLDSDPQPVITKDNVGMSVTTVTFYRLTDPIKAIYEIEDVEFAILNICATTLRDVMGGLDLDDTYTSRDTINEKLRLELDKATNDWGVRVERVEVKDINPPVDIREAMEKQMRAERTKRAQILEAQGLQESQILKANGDKQAQILEAQASKEAKILEAQAAKEAQVLNAQGEEEAIRILAQAEANRIETVYGALKRADISDKIISLESIQALSEIAKSDNKMVVPYESAALMGAVNSLGNKLSSKEEQ